ncbi:hypothetical protein DCC79_04190 [bacterium]|nr:hypothetical protein [Chloroflexi bacterium CFX6]RIL11630.1 MAG: hypothetical protein DCC79_04190 [bacterium]
MALQTTLRFSPSKILVDAAGVTQQGYKAYVSVANHEPFTGALDFEVRVSPLDLSSARTVRGTWAAARGVVDEVPGRPTPTGFYMTRVKPAGAPDAAFSNWAIIAVDDRPLLGANVRYSNTRINPTPPPGSYMLFENRNAAGRPIGFTRIDIETSPSPLGGHVMRFTKDSRDAFWAPGSDWSLRWCLKEVSTPMGTYLVSPGGVSNRGLFPAMGSSRISAVYPNHVATSVSATPALLGGFPEEPEYSTLDVYQQPADQWVFYAVLPKDHRVPEGLSNTPRVLVDLAFGKPVPSVDIDLWHLAALAPTAPGAAVRIRYGETGARIQADRVDVGWSVIEDWEWRTDGLIEKITQWRRVPPLAWRGPGDATARGELATTLSLVEWFVPTADALSVRLAHPAGTKTGDTLDVAAAGDYVLLVQRADGRPYSGFLEIEVVATQGANGVWGAVPSVRRTLWRDARLLPIYVNRGQVRLGFGAHGVQTNFGIMFRARPYLTNASLNALYHRPDAELWPNASTAAFSNLCALTIGSATPVAQASIESLVPGLPV